MSWIVGAITQDGKALWEEVQPLEQLLEELESDTLMGCPEIFFGRTVLLNRALTYKHASATR